MDEKTFEKIFEVLKWAVGIFSTLLFGMGTYIMYLHTQHRRERKEGREETAKQFDRMNEMGDKQDATVEKNTGILQSLKTLLEIDIQTRVKKI